MTLTPGESMPDVSFWGMPNADKLAHFGMFFILAFLMVRGFLKKMLVRDIKNRPFYITLVVTIVYGVLIEYAQSYIPGRSIEFNDMLANGLGSILGVLGYLFLKKNKYFSDFLW